MDFLISSFQGLFTLKGLLYTIFYAGLIMFGWWLGQRSAKQMHLFNLAQMDEVQQRHKGSMLQEWQRLQDNPPPPMLFMGPKISADNMRAATEAELNKIRAGLQKLKNIGCRFEAGAHHKFMEGNDGVFMTRFALYSPSNIVMWETWYDAPQKGGFPVVYETGGLVMWNNVVPLFLRLSWPDTQLRFLKEVFG